MSADLITQAQKEQAIIHTPEAHALQEATLQNLRCALTVSRTQWPILAGGPTPAGHGRPKFSSRLSAN